MTSPKSNVGTAAGTQATFNSGTNYITLASPGESVFAFTGSLAVPTLLGGICASPSGWVTTLNNCDLSPTASSLPNVLNNSLNGNRNYAFAVLPPNGSGYCMRLKSTVRISTDPAVARATIYTASNWETNSASTAYSLPSNSGNVVLPVTFDEISAVAKYNRLSVQWKTTSETNCKEYAVEASSDGNDWISIGTLSSKATNGNSSIPLSYKLEIDLSQITFSVVGLATLLILVRSRRKNYSILFLAVTGIAIFVGCNKDNGRETLTTSSKIFIRVAQQDIDGKINYSKIIQAVLE
ncbi:hypothetical protein [Niabella hibiscisoli]|uniref:hypothetical protein n=1 Tax=Niabella hibiscisoli TaxID=1825928 RepID=UPI001F0DCFAD|nr:hypothetical protein [Niabella hibiscisoli]MCH5717861.1 hypothetical protein [Niabella hibiscisoli]